MKKEKFKLSGEYFCGNKASDYAIKNGYLDYMTLAKAFDAVSSDIISKTNGIIGDWEQENGFIDNSEEIETIEDNISELESSLDNIEEDSTEYTAIQEKIEGLEEQKEELENEAEPEIFQYFIISESGAEILKDYTDEIVFYNEELNMYVWGVTHWGTSWDYVLTDIPLNCGYDD